MNKEQMAWVLAEMKKSTYDERKAGDQFTANGLTVSTAWRPDDMGFETAIIDAVDLHVVEHYGENRDAAVKGHNEWCRRVVNGLTQVKEWTARNEASSKTTTLTPKQ